MSAIYTLSPAPDGASPFGAGARIRFQAATLSDAQSHAQAISTMTQCKIVLENDNTAASGVVRTTYSPGAAGSSVTQVSSVVHR